MKRSNGFPKYIIVTGGVISGVGKGIATASIGKILQEYGFDVTVLKIDPYINFDAGTLRPTEHGEVWVTDDGGEIDQDLGNYERFLGNPFSKKNNITTGQIYSKVIEKERQGKYLGKTVQFIPHIPEEIIRRIRLVSEGREFVLIEIGGTIGDYENIPYLFAIKSLQRDIGDNNMKHIMVTYLPTPKHIGEMKTKPTQQAIKLLSEHGIFPDFILCRAPQALDSVRKKKIETYANIQSEHVISAPDTDVLYRIPLNFQADRLGEKILSEFDIEPRSKSDWSHWEKLTNIIESPPATIKIAMVGKYLDIGKFSLTDSYISVNEALQHAACNNNIGVEIEWISSQDIESGAFDVNRLAGYNGILVPGGFGKEGVEGKIEAIRFARENNIPYLGLCFGMQLAVVEFARNVCGMRDANSTEIDPGTSFPVIDILKSQEDIIRNKQYGGSMRLGAYLAVLKANTAVASLYDERNRTQEDRRRIEEIDNDKINRFRLGSHLDDDICILERHRHRYEVNPGYTKELEDRGLVFSGFHRLSEDETLMEFIELKDHPFFIATQAHPEFKSSIESPSPLFYGFLQSAYSLTN
ncbi:MAG: CTP synthase [bacterium]